jgi:hypothetical protein
MRSYAAFKALGLVTLGVSLASPCLATTSAHHRHIKKSMAQPMSDKPVRSQTGFYPENIEGGVSGNLPFNNQIRKLTDPLNANGAGR